MRPPFSPCAAFRCLPSRGRRARTETSSLASPPAGRSADPDILPLLLALLTESKTHAIAKDDLKVITHRVVHGSTHTDPVVITNEHKDGLREMDKLSEFAPLHVRPSPPCVCCE